MKILLTSFLLLITLAAHSQYSKEGYHGVPAMSITGDFDGNGTQDTFSQFVYDSLGNTLGNITQFSNWDDAVAFYNHAGYRNGFMLNGKPAGIDTEGTIGLLCLINLGNINGTTGDEIALVPAGIDYVLPNTCYIFSLCNGLWQEVYRFNVSESAFSYPYGETEFKPFSNIPGFLEYTNSQWVHVDFFEKYHHINGHNGKLHPLKVANCE